MNNNLLYLGKLLVSLQKRLWLQCNAVLSLDVIKESEFFIISNFFSLLLSNTRERNSFQ